MKNAKKILIISLIVMLMVCSLSINAMTAVGNIDVAYGTPTVDGTIDSVDEWFGANMFTVDSSNAKPWSGDMAGDFKADVYTMWDDSGIYFGGIITDSTFKSSTNDGYGGDAFQISIDLGKVFYGTDNARAVFYSFGCYEDTGIVQVQETVSNRIINDGDEGLAIKTAQTDTGWSFEVYFPWTLLYNDMNEKSGENVTIAAGLQTNVLICYMDKSESGDLLCALGTTVTDENTAFDWGPNEHGITLTLKEYGAIIEEVVAETPAEPTDTAPVSEVSSTPVTAPAPQTGDGFAIFAVLLMTSLVTIIIIKKTKKAE